MLDRHVPLDGAMNLRDVGGLPTHDGGEVRRGRLYRSDNLASLTDGDLEVLVGLDLRTVIDLRADPEVEAQPSRLPTSVAARVHLPMGGSASHQNDWVEQMLSGELEGFGVDDVADAYREMLDTHPEAFATALRTVARADGGAVLVHCTAGKDRTGITVALVLTLLGVDRDLIADDYELSNQLRSDRRIAQLAAGFAERGVDIERFRAFLSAPRPAIEAALAHVDDTHGGAERYLSSGGLTAADLDALRNRLLA